MQLVNNQYQIQGIPVESITAEFETPLYVYDADKIILQAQTLKNAFNGINVKIKYACKALTNISIMKLIKEQGLDIDCVSIQEARMAKMAGFEASQIQYTPSGVEFSEIEEAVAMGLKINVDSIPLLAKFGEKFGSTVPVCLRINPYIPDGGNIKISTAHKDSKFGISCELGNEIVAVVEKYNIKINGLHQHTGSDLRNAKSIFEAAAVLFDMAMNHFKDLEFIDFGGGFKVAYKEGDATTDIEAFGKEASVLFANFCKQYGKELELWFEPGKYLVSECGTFLTKANVVKSSPHRNFVSVNSGLNHLIRPMMYDSYHEILNISNPNCEEFETYDVVGNICETDTFGKDRVLPIVKEGDIIALKNAGAYGFTMSSQYNSRYRPAEVLVINGQAKLIRARETMEDILKNQILVEF
jgi:diaminopimelate decarboxylase